MALRPICDSQWWKVISQSHFATHEIEKGLKIAGSWAIFNPQSSILAV